MDKENIVYLAVFPAPAGMSRLVGSRVYIWVCFPRTCGDEPGYRWFNDGHGECSPHLRG